MNEDAPTCDKCELAVEILPAPAGRAVYGITHQRWCPNDTAKHDEPAFGSVEIDPGSGVTIEHVSRLNALTEQRRRSALALYLQARAIDDLFKIRLVSYRCTAARCLLLDIFTTPAGPAIYFPPVRLSPSRNVNTSPAARLSRTTDKDRRWVEHADLMLAGDEWTYYLDCDHVAQFELASSDARMDVTRRTAEVLVPRG